MRSAVETPRATESDIRQEILNSFMNCPHRDTEQVHKIHEAMREKDPLFYAHLACWYLKNGDLRDHNELFSSFLITDPYTENRETGLALFRKHALFMKSKIVGFIKGKTVKIREKTDKTEKRGKRMVPVISITEKKVGLNKNLPTSLKTEIESYLHWLEADPERFDAVVIRNAKELKALYFSRGKHPFTHGDRAQKVLFKKEYPEDSRLNVFKKVSEASKPEEAARLIVENKIPYVVAVGLVDNITPSVLIALINSMSSQEVINNIASLKEKGAWDNPDIRKILESKLDKAKKSTKVTALKSKTAVETGRVQDESLIKKLDDVADAQIKSKGVIKVPTAIFIDRSGSLVEALEVGKRVAAMISGTTESDLHVVAFDDAPLVITAAGKSLSDWERAFKPVRTGGNTSIGCALKYLRENKRKVEQIVVITDEGENAQPYFYTEYPLYFKEMGISPHVYIIHVGKPYTVFKETLKTFNIPFDIFTPDGDDYYGLPGLIPLLSKKTKLDLVMEIMNTPLLKRSEFRL